jgi:antitoxin MazE
MRTKLVRIGNSKGIRIPKAILQQAGLADAVELRVVGENVVISSTRRKRRPRAGWAEAIDAENARAGPPPVDAELESLVNEWDEDEWRW